MPESDPSQPSTQRRRSERIAKSVPIIVRGIDLLGQPFEERTSTLALNLQGCRYPSKHHLPKNTWVTLEVAQGDEHPNLRARVAWIQRPHSVRELFQIAVELESPGNIWGIESPPPDWELASMPGASCPGTIAEAQSSEAAGIRAAAGIAGDAGGSPIEGRGAEHAGAAPASESPIASGFVPGAESPLLAGWNAELRRLATEAVEAATSRAESQIRQSLDELESAQTDATARLAAELGVKRGEWLAELRSEFDRTLPHVQELIREIEKQANALRAECETAQETASRLAQTRLHAEAAEAARRPSAPESSPEIATSIEEAAATWRKRLESDTDVARMQWNELLQSSLDSSVERLARQLSGRSQEALREAEQKIAERLADLRQPLERASSEAQRALDTIKTALDEELARAKTALAEAEAAASRITEHAGQIEAASQDAINELQRRTEGIVETQLGQMKRHAESLMAGVPGRIAPALDAAGRELVERTQAEIESKIAARVEHIPELLRELATREAEAEEALRLHRERLRQLAENSQREAASQMAATLAGLGQDFEAARKEALAKWNEELEAAGVRASHAAAESFERSSEWFQQDARARVQVLVEQAMAGASSRFEEQTADAARKFESHMEEQASRRIEQARGQLDGAAGEVTQRAHSELARAAETAAASFGQVLHGITEREVQQFTEAGRGALQERTRDLESFAEKLLHSLESGAEKTMDRFRAQMGSETEMKLSQGRSALATEFAAELDRYRAGRDALEKTWAGTLERASEEAAARFQERLETAGDSWMMSSVRRLNEHGQNAVESLLRSADQALRDSCSKVFEGLSAMLRERVTNAVAVPGFGAPPVRETPDPPAPHNESAPSGANA